MVTSTPPATHLCAYSGLCSWVGRLWRRTTILPLTCCYIKRVSSSLKKSLRPRGDIWINLCLAQLITKADVHTLKFALQLTSKHSGFFNHISCKTICMSFACRIPQTHEQQAYFYFCFIWSFTGFWHFGPLLLPLSVCLHHSTQKGTFVLFENTHKSTRYTRQTCREMLTPFPSN